MSKAYRYAVIRRSIIEETFWIDADSEDEALDKARDGDYDESQISTEWIDWHDDDYSMDPDIEPEPLCPLYKMIKERECDTTS
jgi:hypothetical protein